jgi:acyl-CoA thioesterase
LYEFDEDTRVERVGPGAYAGRMTDRWGIGTVPNGGYVLAVALSALGDALDAPDPLTVTAHYLRPGRVAPVRVEVETIKVGRSFTTAGARLVQGDDEIVRVLSTWGELGDHPEKIHVGALPPALPPRDAAERRTAPPGSSIVDRVDLRLDPATAGFQRGERAELAEIRGWIRFADGRPPDVHSLGLFADAFPPSVFSLIAPGWVPTIELTVHFRARPTTPWLQCVFRTRFVQGDLLEEDGELWDESGTLVALSRQLAAMPRPRPTTGV